MTDANVLNTRKVVAFRAPSKHTALGYESPKKGPLKEVALANLKECGDRLALTTPNGSLTAAMYTQADLGTITIWYSYETPIAIVAHDLEVKVLSNHRYSSTTNRHQSAIRSGLMGRCRYAIHIDDHILQGGTYADVIAQREDELNKALGKLKNARSVDNYVWNVSRALSELKDAMSELDPEYKPTLVRPDTTDKTIAKMTAWRLHHPAMAELAATLEAHY